MPRTRGRAAVGRSAARARSPAPERAGGPDRPPARRPRGAARPRRGRTCRAGAPASSSSSTAPPARPRGPGPTPAAGRSTRRSRGPSAAGPAALDRSVGSRRRTGCAERSRTIALPRACFHHRRRFAPRGLAAGRDGDDGLGAGADVGGELIPAAHGLELRGRGGGGAVQLVDRGVEALARALGLSVGRLGDLAGGDVAPPAPRARALERVRQMHGVVPAVPLGLDGRVDLDGDDQQAAREIGAHQSSQSFSLSLRGRYRLVRYWKSLLASASSSYLSPIESIRLIPSCHGFFWNQL